MITDWIPPAVLPLARALWPNANRYRGPFTDWNEANRNSKGYDNGMTISRITEAARASRSGTLIDQDGVLVPAVPHFSLIASILKSRRNSRAAPVVLDLGGALGSSYRANSFALPSNIEWRIVEQTAIVTVGTKEFATGPLSFFDSISEACAKSVPDVALLASVLQYLQDPWSTLSEVASSGASSVLIDRTPFVMGQFDLPCVQTVPNRIYPGSYPLWLLSRQRLKSVMSDWVVRLERPSREGRALTSRFRPFEFYDIMLERR